MKQPRKKAPTFGDLMDFFKWSKSKMIQEVISELLYRDINTPPQVEPLPGETKTTRVEATSSTHAEGQSMSTPTANAVSDAIARLRNQARGYRG